MAYISIALFMCLTFFQIQGEQQAHKRTKIINEIFQNYDPSILPEAKEEEKADGKEGPVIVTVNVFLRRMEINDVEMEHTVQLTFRQFWTDKRLKYSQMGESVQFVILDPKDPQERIWKPDTFFPNDVEDDNDDDEDHANSVTKIDPDGDVTYSQRFTSTFSCPMALGEYPWDEQKCSLEIASYGHNTEEVRYVWQTENPVTFRAGFNHSLIGFEIDNVTTSYCDSVVKDVKYSCLRLSVTLDRTKSMETHKMFGYSLALVFASWIPFWIKPFDTAARAVIGVSCFITTVIFNHLVTDETPIENASYVTAVHVWTDATLAFVFLALLQLKFVVLLSPRTYPTNSGVSSPEQGGLIKRQSDEAEPSIFSIPFKDYHWGKRLDIVCRILFPVAYAIFNIVFWSIYSD